MLSKVIAGAFEQVEYEGPICGLQLRQPSADAGCLIVRHGGAWNQQVADADLEGLRELFKRVERGHSSAALEAADGLWLDTNALGQIGLSLFLGLAQCGDLGAEALRQRLARMLLLDHICWVF